MLAELIYKAVQLLLAVVFHEAAHGYVAYLEGDLTAKRAGRLTLNPLKHIDPVFTVILPLLLILSGSPVIFGAAKPVPVNPYEMRRGMLSFALVSAGGLAANLILALVNSLLLPFGGRLSDFFATGIWLNSFLFVFNALPIPPLDGSRIVYLFLSPRYRAIYDEVERYGILLVFAIIYFFGELVYRVASFVANIFFLVSKNII